MKGKRQKGRPEKRGEGSRRQERGKRRDEKGGKGKKGNEEKNGKGWKGRKEGKGRKGREGEAQLLCRPFTFFHNARDFMAFVTLKLNFRIVKVYFTNPFMLY